LFRLTAFVSFFLLYVLTLPVSAFTPDDEELSSLMQKNYGALSSWEAEMSFPAAPNVKAHVWYARGKWRQEWTGGGKAIGMNGNVVAKCVVDDFALSPLFVWMPPNPVETWKSWGVDNATSSYGFCDTMPCYLFGAEPGDESTPMVQLNNEDMSPLVVRYRSDKGLTTVTYGEYRTLGGFRVPQSVSLVVEGDSVLEAKVKWIAVNRADGEELYARDALDTAPCAVPPTPFDVLRDSFRYPMVK